MATIEQVRTILDNPARYTDTLYRTDPDLYTAVPVYQAFLEQFKREPTTQELAMFQPLVESLGHGGAKAEIAKYAYQQENTPEKVAERKRLEVEGKSPQFYGSVDNLFQSTLGRAASDAEKKHFGTLLADGSVDEYSLGQWLQQLPEHVTKQDADFRKSMSDELQGQDQQYYSEKIMPAIEQKFARAGRSVDSTGYASMLALAAQDQNRQRESFLSNLTASQYAGNKANARDDYRTYLDRYFGTQDYNRDRNASLQDSYTGRLNELQNFDIQRKAYEQYLKKYGKRSSGIGSLVGGVIGTGVGAYFDGPAGASAGYGLGSSAGSAAEGLF